ncbi:MAG: 50S ribosomal protein L9 [Actinobacteria bacterium]|nr:MAG: 50S ribosomal protein L9 [Actinomycetota bacterium]
MKVILRADVPDVGHKGDVLDVADGYGRNYLVPRGLAMAASKGALAQAESMRRARAVRDAHDREAAEEVATKLTPLTITIPARAGAEGRLFGSVTPAEVAAAVQAQAGVEVDRRRLHLDEPIRALGAHEVPLRLHPDVEVRLNVEVVAE